MFASFSSPTLSLSGVAGFRPGSRSTFLSGKVDKTMLAVMWPFGFPARFADSGGAQTRCAQTVHAFFPESPALLGHTTMPEKTVETGNNESSIIEDQLAEPALSLLEGLKQGPPIIRACIHGPDSRRQIMAGNQQFRPVHDENSNA
jgi:hypothetical protein